MCHFQNVITFYTGNEIKQKYISRHRTRCTIHRNFQNIYRNSNFNKITPVLRAEKNPLPVYQLRQSTLWLNNFPLLENITAKLTVLLANKVFYSSQLTNRPSPQMSIIYQATKYGQLNISLTTCHFQKDNFLCRHWNEMQLYKQTQK